VIGYIIRRLLVSVLAVAGAATVVFLVIRLIPGDAVAIMAAEGGLPRPLKLPAPGWVWISPSGSSFRCGFRSC